jgi:hypothetical protein
MFLLLSLSLCRFLGAEAERKAATRDPTESMPERYHGGALNQRRL